MQERRFEISQVGGKTCRCLITKGSDPGRSVKREKKMIIGLVDLFFYIDLVIQCQVVLNLVMPALRLNIIYPVMDCSLHLFSSGRLSDHTCAEGNADHSFSIKIISYQKGFQQQNP